MIMIKFNIFAKKINIKNVLILVSVLVFTACNRQVSSIEKYIENPRKSDSLCIEDIERAKKMVENGEIIFCYPMYFGSSELRQEKQLRLLCEQYKLIFDYELFGCVVIERQTQGCFGAYMDKVIVDKFGADFKQKLLAQADSIMIAVNDTVPYYLCDKKPKIHGVIDKHESEYLMASVVPEELRKQLKTDNDGKSSFMDIGFYIDKDGNTSGYFINNFYDANNKSNQLFKDDLFNIAVTQLKQVERWEPGIVNNQKVITENNVRVFFQ